MRFLIKNLYRYLGIDIIQYSRIYKKLVKLYAHIYISLLFRYKSIKI